MLDFYPVCGLVYLMLVFACAISVLFVLYLAMLASVPHGSLQEGLGRLILRPCVPGSITLAVLIMSLVVPLCCWPSSNSSPRSHVARGVELMVLRYIKPSDQTWEFIQDILFCSLGVFKYHFVLVPFLHLQTDVK